MNVLLRQIGNRVGLELAFSLRSLSNDIDFLNEMIDWEFAGLGKMSYDIDPHFQSKSSWFMKSQKTLKRYRYGSWMTGYPKGH